MKPRVFGSSCHKESNRWQVWTYDISDDTIQPWAAYEIQLKAETAASDLAHAAAKMREAECLAEIDRSRDAAPVHFDPLIEAVLKMLIYDTIKWSNVPESSKCEIAVRRSDLDQIFVVTFPRQRRRPLEGASSARCGG